MPSADEEQQPLLRHVPSESHFMSARCDVYNLLLRVKHQIVAQVDVPMSVEALLGPRMTMSVTKPLEDEYYRLEHPAIVYVLFVCRVHFLRMSTAGSSLTSVNATRAALCETLAICVLRRIFDEDEDDQHSSSQTLLKMANVLVRNYDVWQGAPSSVLPEEYEAARAHGDSSPAARGQTSALELAILTSAKNFIRGQACQRVVQGIYEGKIVYSASASYHLLPDNYKRKPIALYDPEHAPFLDHYRLQVPRIRAALETFYFLVLFCSYFGVLETRRINQPPNIFEWWFILYGLGFTLDKFTSTLEHGWKVYSANLWNSLDALFCVNFAVYLALLANGSVIEHHNVLSCAAVFLMPRLVFVLLSDNVMVLAIRAMLGPFMFLMGLAIVCFSGFIYSLWLLGSKEFSLSQIAESLVLIWFGLDGRGMDVSTDFHPIFGPLIYFLYACFSNTLLTTILVAILTAVFARIDRDPAAESLYRRTVVIFSGIKSDGLFNYQPPVNLLAFFVFIPLRLLMTPRKFHSLNVFCTRVFSSPVLVVVAVLEGRHLRFMPHPWRTYWAPLSWFGKVVNPSHFWNPRRDIDVLFDTKTFLADTVENAHPHGKSDSRLSVHKGRKAGSSRLTSFRSPTPSRPASPVFPTHPPVRPRRESMLASIYAPNRATINDLSEAVNNRLDSIEETQRHIQEAVNAFLNSQNPVEGA